MTLPGKTARLSSWRLPLLALPLLILAGCSNSLKVSGEFPAPLVEPLGPSLGIVYDDDFRGYVYREQSEDRSQWVIDSGSAQVQLLQRVLPALFAQVAELKSLPSSEAPAATDLVLHPRLVEFQYSVPRETRFKLYEVWLKYQFKLYDAEGEAVADWTLTAYGKTPSAFMQSQEDAMNAAVVVALRDLGANLALRTRRQPELVAWLARQPQADAPRHALAGEL